MAWAPDYATVEQLADYLRIGDPVDDDQLALAITGASRAVDFDCNRQFGKVSVAEARNYSVQADYERGLWVVEVDDVQTVTSLAVTVDGTAVATYVKEPRNAPQKGRPWTRLVFVADSETQPAKDADVAVTAVWGWTAVPTTIQQTTLLQASRIITRRNAPFGVLGSPDSGGAEMRLLAKIDPDVAVLLRSYRRLRAVA